MKREEYSAISKALATWWRSQGIEPNDAAVIMAGMAGGICGVYANDEEHLQEGVDILVKELKRGAKVTKGKRGR